MAALVYNRKDVLIWYFLKKKAHSSRSVYQLQRHKSQLERFVRSLEKCKKEFIQAVITSVNIPRYKVLWMYERSMVWFDMVEESFTNEQWYENFREHKETFEFILNKISRDITHKDTTMRKAISPIDVAWP
jgi:hypothetical protein